jgi:hypothetical protein
MLNFKKWLNELAQPHQIDDRQINILYKQAHIAVEIAKWYKPDLFNKVYTIANLTSGAYGLYTTKENIKDIPQNVATRLPNTNLIHYGQVNSQNKESLQKLPLAILRTYFPSLPQNSIRVRNTVHVNISRIMREFPDELNRVREIASTLVHEARHVEDDEEHGHSAASEDRAYGEERAFAQWWGQNLQQILRKYPQLNNQPILPQI